MLEPSKATPSLDRRSHVVAVPVTALPAAWRWRRMGLATVNAQVGTGILFVGLPVEDDLTRAIDGGTTVHLGPSEVAVCASRRRSKGESGHIVKSDSSPCRSFRPAGHRLADLRQHSPHRTIHSHRQDISHYSRHSHSVRTRSSPS